MPEEYFGYFDENQRYDPGLKPKNYLTPKQKEQVTRGAYRCLPVHPTQLYTSAAAALCTLILFGVWRRSQKAERVGIYPLLAKPGSVFSLMFVLYGVLRYCIELFRDDNPFEIGTLTVSQLIGMGLVVLGAGLLIFYTFAKPETLPAEEPGSEASAKAKPALSAR